MVQMGALNKLTMRQNGGKEMDYKKLFTSESVTEGHPDKISDILSDAILDAIIKNDPEARVACEVTVTTGLVVVVGEISTKSNVDINTIVRETIREVGYDRAKYGFDCDTCGVICALDKQSDDIALGVNKALEVKEGNSDEGLGAGDQGMMFGFACDETKVYMPMAIYLAHKMAKRLTDVRKNKILPYLRPDGKTQVTVEYDDNGNVLRIDTVVVSSQHDADIDMTVLRKDIEKEVIRATVPAELMDDETKIYINPTGRFVIGGPQGDSGHTGRKIIVDTYGGYARHGGGAFSGKDPTKVDRSAAYAARYVAKNIVAAGLAHSCEVQLAYAIGVAKPVSLRIDTFGTGAISEEKLVEIVNKNFDLSPSGIISMLDLRRPIYKKSAAYGHFGRDDADFPWEKVDKADALKKDAGI